MNIIDVIAKTFQLYMLIGSIYTSGPLMVALSTKMDAKKLARFILVEALGAFLFAIIFAHAGPPVLKYLGITLCAMKCTGGMLLLFTGFDLLGISSSEGGGVLDTNKEMFLVPIAFPILTGPATLFTIASFPRSEMLLTDISIFLACVMTFCTMRIFASNVNLLGETSTKIISKFAGLFVASLGLQMMLDGFWNFK